jgi:hypothetical protein
MRSLYVLGGQQRSLRPLRAGNQNWEGYQKGLVLQVCPETGESQIRVEYAAAPPISVEEEQPITFQAGELRGDRLYVCTQTEVMIYSLPAFERLAYVSLPCFNDVHHVRATPEGNFLIANAGLEMVMEVTLDGEVRRVWNVLGEDPWGRFSREIDYRGMSTKPHRSHPNFVFYVDGEIWATRFHQGDALCLTDPEKRIPISSERIHDGVVHAGRIYFTTVNGTVVVANPRTLQVDEVIDLNSMHTDDALHGWCRGILMDAGKIWVGFSRIRPTKFRENVSWVMHGFKRALPTHVACYDLERQRRVAELDLESAGLSAIYSIFPTSEQRLGR